MLKFLDDIAKYWIFWERWPESGFITLVHTGQTLITFCPKNEWDGTELWGRWYYGYCDFKPYKGFYLRFFGIEASIG